eukprot:1661775-Prymnesium_polylepis.1
MTMRTSAAPRRETGLADGEKQAEASTTESMAAAGGGSGEANLVDSLRRASSGTSLVLSRERAGDTAADERVFQHAGSVSRPRPP